MSKLKSHVEKFTRDEIRQEMQLLEKRILYKIDDLRNSLRPAAFEMQKRERERRAAV